VAYLIAKKGCWLDAKGCIYRVLYKQYIVYVFLFFGNARCAVAGFFRALATTSKRMKKISAHAEEMMEALKDFDEKMEKEVRDLSKEEGWTLVDAYIERASTSALKSALEVCNKRRAGRTPGCVAGNS